MEYLLNIYIEIGVSGKPHDTTVTVVLNGDETEEEKEEIFDQIAKQHFNNCCSYGYDAAPKTTDNA